MKANTLLLVGLTIVALSVWAYRHEPAFLVATAAAAWAILQWRLSGGR